MSDGNRARWLWPLGIGLGVVALVIVALARQPVQLDPSTAEGTVQAYLQAISDEDYNKAFEALDPEGFEGCSTSDLARNAPREAFTATLGFSEDADEFRPIGTVGGSTTRRGTSTSSLFISVRAGLLRSIATEIAARHLD